MSNMLDKANRIVMGIDEDLQDVEIKEFSVRVTDEIKNNNITNQFANAECKLLEMTNSDLKLQNKLIQAYKEKYNNTYEAFTYEYENYIWVYADSIIYLSSASNGFVICPCRDSVIRVFDSRNGFMKMLDMEFDNDDYCTAKVTDYKGRVVDNVDVCKMLYIDNPEDMKSGLSGLMGE